jgi:hypothetical protein
VNFNVLKLKIKSKVAHFDLFDWSLDFLLKKNRIFLLIFSLAIFSYCAYLWYVYIYNPEWNEIRKQVYIESWQEEEVVFNKNRFNKVIAELENRKNNFFQSTENIPDIFSLK